MEKILPSGNKIIVLESPLTVQTDPNAKVSAETMAIIRATEKVIKKSYKKIKVKDMRECPKQWNRIMR